MACDIAAALHRLAHEGVVTLLPNRGAFVAMPDVAEARDVFEARRSIEDTIVRRAAAQLRPAQIRRLRGLLARERAAHAAGNRSEAIRLSGDFHRLLADFAGNRVLAAFLHELVARTSLVLSLYAPHDGRACATDEHAAILDALANHDARASARLMERHLREIEESIALADRADAGMDLAEILRGSTDREEPLRR